VGICSYHKSICFGNILTTLTTLRIIPDDGRINCRQCSDCGAGFRVARLCSRFADRLCVPCDEEEHQYSDGLNWAKCKSCGTCEIGQTIAQNCTAGTNRRCADRKCIFISKSRRFVSMLRREPTTISRMDKRIRCL
jgi:hypothetical protein